MGQSRVNSYHECGTVHCVAGWYAIAVYDTDKKLVDFLNGANKMAKALGFNKGTQLRAWAKRHPEIWGNQFGTDMFYCSIAYNNAKTISEVIRYLEGVQSRSPIE